MNPFPFIAFVVSGADDPLPLRPRPSKSAEPLEVLTLFVIAKMEDNLTVILTGKIPVPK